jgi:hypothetical protein
MDVLHTDLIAYLDIETLIALYMSSKSISDYLESMEALFIISKAHDLNQSNSFKELVKKYDRKYITIRSFKYLDYNECFRRAAKIGDVNIFTEAIERGANDYKKAILYAASGNQKYIIELLTNKNFVRNFYDGDIDYNVSLLYAVMSGNLDLTIKSITFGATNYLDAISVAPFGENKDVINILIDNSPYIDLEAYNDAFIAAASIGNKEIIDMMLDKGAYEYGRAIEEAAFSGKKDILSYVLERALVNIKNHKRVNCNQKYYNSAIVNAATMGHADILIYLLDIMETNNIYVPSNIYEKAIEGASLEGNINTINIIFDKLSDGKHYLNSNMYDIALSNASFGGHINIIDIILIEAFANEVNIDSNMIKKAIVSAAKGGHINIIKTFIKMLPKSNINKTNYNEIMVKASEFGNINIVKLMIDLGADNFGSAMEFAAKRGHIDIIEMIISLLNNIGINISNDSYNKIMTNAAIEGYKDVVELALHNGADNYAKAKNASLNSNNNEIYKILSNFEIASLQIWFQ